MANELLPSVSLLVKLGSIVVHADEITEDGGANAHEFDVQAIRTLLADPEVAKWIKGMSGMAYLPRKRNAK